MKISLFVEISVIARLRELGMKPRRVLDFILVI